MAADVAAARLAEVRRWPADRRYAQGLRRAMERRRDELLSLEQALALYEQRCALEEEVRSHGIGMDGL